MKTNFFQPKDKLTTEKITFNTNVPQREIELLGELNTLKKVYPRLIMPILLMLLAIFIRPSSYLEAYSEKSKSEIDLLYMAVVFLAFVSSSYFLPEDKPMVTIRDNRNNNRELANSRDTIYKGLH